MAWSTLEVGLNELVYALLDLPRRAEHDVRFALTANIDFREKIQIILSIGLKKRASDDWYEQLKTLLDTIDNDLRVQRNRYVHDFWFAEDDGRVRKTQYRTSIKKPQAREFFELSTYQETMPHPDDIWELTNRVRMAFGSLVTSASILRHHQASIGK